ncbi:hypothetical protein J4456_03670 [Candidatus Pacearchaeota archaeon]|nr:hypothetical protein [Candidatus Pacearchaeota archaeon]
MLSFDDINYEHSLEIYCPKCGTDDVVIEVALGHCHFSRCNICGYKNSEEE